MAPNTRRDLLKRASVLGAGAVLAGCTGPLSPGTPDAGSSTGDSSPTEMSRGTPEPTTDTPTVTAYADLSDEGKRLFGQLRDEGAVTNPGYEIPSSLLSTDYVRHNGTPYEVIAQPRGAISIYSVTAEPAPDAAVGQNEPAITTEELSDPARDAFETARTGEFTTRKELPTELEDHSYVKYRGDYFALSKTVGDVRKWRLSVTER